VAVFGCGGLGMNCIQIAAAAGGRVIAVDFNIPLREGHSKTKLEMAVDLGASSTVDAEMQEGVSKEIRRMSGGGVDVAFEMIGRPETLSRAYSSLRPGGRLVVVGFSPKDATYSPGRMLVKELEVVGSCGCPSADIPKIIELVKDRRILLDPLITAKYPLSEVNSALEAVRRRECIRIVLIP
jgi:S-(hydroxymethyl)glutathione dehydrogenase/alcohol dehydrogenase